MSDHVEKGTCSEGRAPALYRRCSRKLILHAPIHVSIKRANILYVLSGRLTSPTESLSSIRMLDAYRVPRHSRLRGSVDRNAIVSATSLVAVTCACGVALGCWRARQPGSHEAVPTKALFAKFKAGEREIAGVA
jgi:hypothetical protein